MSSIIIRPLGPGDLPAVRRIWSASFGDSEELVERLMLEYGLLAGSLGAEYNGKICAQFSMLEGLKYEDAAVTYLYALCTAPEYRSRGCGSALVNAAASRAFERGADIVCLSPASQALEEWYSSIGFMSTSFLISEPVLPNFEALALTAVSPEEYLSERGFSSIIPSMQILNIQQLFFDAGTGGFFRIDCSGNHWYICAEIDNNSLFIKDYSCPYCLLSGAAFKLMQVFNTDKIFRFIPSERGVAQLMYLCRKGFILCDTGHLYLPFTLA